MKNYPIANGNRYISFPNIFDSKIIAVKSHVMSMNVAKLWLGNLADFYKENSK